MRVPIMQKIKVVMVPAALPAINTIPHITTKREFTKAPPCILKSKSKYAKRQGGREARKKDEIQSN